MLLGCGSWSGLCCCFVTPPPRSHGRVLPLLGRPVAVSVTRSPYVPEGPREVCFQTQNLWRVLIQIRTNLLVLVIKKSVLLILGRFPSQQRPAKPAHPQNIRPYLLWWVTDFFQIVVHTQDRHHCTKQKQNQNKTMKPYRWQVFLATLRLWFRERQKHHRSGFHNIVHYKINWNLRMTYLTGYFMFVFNARICCRPR